MNIIISNSSKEPIYQQIETQIKAMILQGVLAEGELLPSMRTLAKELRISLITTKRAYEELERDGFIETVSGKGSFVAGQNLDLVREQHLKEIEDLLSQAVAHCAYCKLSLDELKEILEMIYKGE